MTSLKKRLFEKQQSGYKCIKTIFLFFNYLYNFILIYPKVKNFKYNTRKLVTKRFIDFINHEFFILL